MDHSLAFIAHTSVGGSVLCSTHNALSRKRKHFEQAKYGQGNVNMGAGSGETRVRKGDGDILDKLQPAI